MMKYSPHSFFVGVVITLFATSSIFVVHALSWPSATPDVSETSGGQFSALLKKMLVDQNLDSNSPSQNGYVNLSTVATALGGSPTSKVMELVGTNINISGKINLNANNGNITSSGTITSLGNISAPAFLYSSDRRLKQNIETLTNPLDIIAGLRGVSFNWRSDGRPDIGVVAQEVEQVLPSIVHTNLDTGMKSVEYGNLVAVLIESVKAQQKEIEELQKEVQSLRNSR